MGGAGLRGASGPALRLHRAGAVPCRTCNSRFSPRRSAQTAGRGGYANFCDPDHTLTECIARDTYMEICAVRWAAAIRHRAGWEVPIGVPNRNGGVRDRRRKIRAPVVPTLRTRIRAALEPAIPTRLRPGIDCESPKHVRDLRLIYRVAISRRNRRDRAGCRGLKFVSYCWDVLPQKSHCNLLSDVDPIQDALAYVGPVLAVCGVILAWVYEQASARLGIVDLFAMK